MSNTHTELLYVLRCLAGSTLVAGIALVISATSVIMNADLTGQGTTIFDRNVISHEMKLESAVGHAAASVLDTRPDLRSQLLVGMLLILLGFAFYSMWIVRMRPVHAKRKSPPFGKLRVKALSL